GGPDALNALRDELRVRIELGPDGLPFQHHACIGAAWALSTRPYGRAAPAFRPVPLTAGAPQTSRYPKTENSHGSGTQLSRRALGRVGGTIRRGLRQCRRGESVGARASCSDP